MRIKSVQWANYRNLNDARIEVRTHLALIGPNDSGKSSILRAVDLCLNAASTQLTNVIHVADFKDPALPLELRVTFSDLDKDDLSVFPDEVDHSQSPPLLVMAVQATVDEWDEPVVAEARRYFPFGPDSERRRPTREQMHRIGWSYVAASRSMIRELSAQTGAAQAVLNSVDLGADLAGIEEAHKRLDTALAGAPSLTALREQLARALTSSLPEPRSVDDIEILSTADLESAPLAGVALTIRTNGRQASLAEQSDGVRAIAVLALLGISHEGSQVVGIDEPETHLHPSAQRAFARTLRAGGTQRLIATHSAAIVSVLDPLDLVSVSADGQVSQLAPVADIVDTKNAIRYWGSSLLEALTARSIIVVEGPSDRLICQALDEVLDLGFDRHGIYIFELAGKESFPLAFKLFGPAGFALNLGGITDHDGREAWAKIRGVDASLLESDGYLVCEKDLEEVYVKALGYERVLEILTSSTLFAHGRSLLSRRKLADIEDATEDDLIDYCHSKKVECAASIARAMRPADAEKLTVLTRFFHQFVL